MALQKVNFIGEEMVISWKKDNVVFQEKGSKEDYNSMFLKENLSPKKMGHFFKEASRATTYDNGLNYLDIDQYCVLDSDRVQVRLKEGYMSGTKQDIRLIKQGNLKQVLLTNPIHPALLERLKEIPDKELK